MVRTEEEKEIADKLKLKEKDKYRKFLEFLFN